MGFALLQQHQQDQQQLSKAKTEASEAQSMVSMSMHTCVQISTIIYECSVCQLCCTAHHYGTDFAFHSFIATKEAQHTKMHCPFQCTGQFKQIVSFNRIPVYASAAFV